MTGINIWSLLLILLIVLLLFGTKKLKNIGGDLGGAIKNFKKVLKVTLREEAIAVAGDLVNPGDIVLIAGKGHETYQEIEGKKIPFNDLEIAKKYF